MPSSYHGTPRGYTLHLEAHEAACDACKTANRRRLRAYRIRTGRVRGTIVENTLIAELLQHAPSDLVDRLAADIGLEQVEALFDFARESREAVPA